MGNAWISLEDFTANNLMDSGGGNVDIISRLYNK
jgi:hypothetical protein